MKRTVILLAALGLLLTACGSDKDSRSAHMEGGDGGEPTRTIDVQMVDNAFAPRSVAVKAGETVEFRFTNAGKVDHEAILGDEHAQREHENEMNGRDDMSGHDMGDDMEHDDEAITVKPGKTRTLTHTFTAGDDGTLIGCHEPDHYKDGMKLKVAVT